MQTFTNNAYGFLASGVSAAATTLVLGTGEGARFPTTSGDNFKITLIALTNGQETAWEIVNVTGRSSDTLTVQRAQEGTTALVWPSLTRVELRLTAGATESKANLGTAAYTASTDYATAAKGVTNGDSHDHSGGDGGQIAYSGLSGLPTLGTAAAKNIPASGNASATEVVYGSDTRLHVAATVADTNSINLTLTGQQISADAIFGTTSTTIAAGDHAHAALYVPLGHVGAGGTAHANVVAAGAAGFMTGADKTKLDGVASGATANTGTVTSVSGTAPIAVATGTSTPTISISAATTSAAGSMSAADKTKLDGVTGALVGTTDTQTLSAKTVTGLRETKVAMAANAIDLAAGNYFTKTISGTGVTFTVSNTPASGTVGAFILELTNGGAYVFSFWSGITWAGGTVPVLTASGVDILGFYSHDGGTTWRGLVLALDSQ